MSLREEGKNKEERGKWEEQSELDEGFIYRMTFTTGSWHESVLKVVLYKPFVHLHSVLPPFPSPSPLFFPSSSRVHHKICPKFVKICRPPSIQMITKVSNFVLSSLIARLALALVYIVINCGF